MSVSVCSECRASTSGSCWRHPRTFPIAPAVTMDDLPTSSRAAEVRTALAAVDREREMRAELRAEVERLRERVEHLEMEISEKAAWIERDRREPDKVLLNVASLRRALDV